MERVQFHRDKLAFRRERKAKSSTSSFCGFSSPHQDRVPVFDITSGSSWLAQPFPSSSYYLDVEEISFDILRVVGEEISAQQGKKFKKLPRFPTYPLSGLGNIIVLRVTALRNIMCGPMV